MGGTGRKKIEIKEIENRQRRNVTFTKRRKGLFKKAQELSKYTGAEIALLVFSPGGNPFTYSSSSSSFNHLLNYYILNNNVEDEQVAGTSGSSDGFWWNQLNPVEIDSIDKLIGLKNQLLDVKEQIANRKQELLALSRAAKSVDSAEEMVEASSPFPMDDDLGKLLSDGFDTVANWLPEVSDDANNWLVPFADSVNLSEELDDFERMPPPPNDSEVDLDCSSSWMGSTGPELIY